MRMAKLGIVSLWRQPWKLCNGLGQGNTQEYIMILDMTREPACEHAPKGLGNAKNHE